MNVTVLMWEIYTAHQISTEYVYMFRFLDCVALNPDQIRSANKI